MNPLLHQRGCWWDLTGKKQTETNVPKDGFSGFMLQRLLEELSQTEFWCLEISPMSQLAALKKRDIKQLQSMFV